MRQLSFKRYRFPRDIIGQAIWLYARFTLSFRDVEEMLAERGLDVSYETIRRWFLTFGSIIAANLRRTRPKPSDHWHLDESAPRDPRVSIRIYHQKRFRYDKRLCFGHSWADIEFGSHRIGSGHAMNRAVAASIIRTNGMDP